MKLYERKPEEAIRVRITQIGSQAEYFTLCECTVKEAHTHFLKVLSGLKESGGAMTNVQMRETVDGKNGKAKQFSFSGLTPKQTKELLVKSIEK